MKANLKILVIFISGLIIAVGLQYYLFKTFLGYISEEIVNAWYYGEIINLQEGQILPAITKNQNLLQNSKFINAVVLLDKNDPDKYLFSVGELASKINSRDLVEFNSKIKSKSVGFLKSHVVVPISKNRDLFMIYEFSSQALRWTFFFTLAAMILSIIYLIIYTQKVLLISHEKKLMLSAEIRERLTHDLKSPLLSLSSIEKEISKFGHKKVVDTYRMSLDRIKQLIDATENTSQKYSDMQRPDLSTEVKKCDVLKVLKDIIAENEFTLKSTKNIHLHCTEDLSSVAKDKVYIQISELDLKRHINNLIANSMEAIDHSNGEIKVTLKCDFSHVIIQVQDNGKGISSEIVGKIGDRGFTDGKINGHGFGIYYFKKDILDLKGSLKVQSEESKGTLISISLPIYKVETVNLENTFNQEKIVQSGVRVISKTQLFNAIENNRTIQEICFKENSLLIFVDDDKVILNLWNDYLKKYKILNKALCFSSPEDFEQWFFNSEVLFDEVQFFFDYQISPLVTGFDLIKKFGLEKESVIVTNMI